MVRRGVRVITFTLVAVLTSPAAVGEDLTTVYPLTFVVNRDPDIRFRSIGRSISPEPPFPVTGVPARASLIPQYSLVRLGLPAREHVYVVYGSGAGYNMFIIDTDCDRDLSNDEVHLGVLNDRGQFAFDPVEVTVQAHGVTYPYHLEPTADAETGFTYLRCGAYYAGSVAFGDIVYTVAVFDDNYNGLFGDRFVFSPSERRWKPGDVLSIDLDQNGRFDIRAGYSTETFCLGRYLAVDGGLYEFEVAPDGRWLTLRDTETTHGYVTINSDRRCSVELVGTDGPLRITGRPGELAKAPADMFGFHAWYAEGKMSQGVTWKAVCYGDLSASVTILPRTTTQLELPQLRPYAVHVTLEQTDDLGRAWSLTGEGVPTRQTLASIANGPDIPEVGPPIKTTISCQRKANEMQFSLRLEGRGGEKYRPSRILTDGQRVRQPRLFVTDSRGNLVHQGRFKYG
jgi:hypothetical protein